MLILGCMTQNIQASAKFDACSSRYGSVRSRFDLASLRTAAIEFPAVRTKSASCSSDTFKRLRTIRTCTRLFRSSLLRAPVNWRPFMEVFHLLRDNQAPGGRYTAPETLSGDRPASVSGKQTG